MQITIPKIISQFKTVYEERYGVLKRQQIMKIHSREKLTFYLSEFMWHNLGLGITD